MRVCVYAFQPLFEVRSNYSYQGLHEREGKTENDGRRKKGSGFIQANEYKEETQAWQKANTACEALNMLYTNAILFS